MLKYKGWKIYWGNNVLFYLYMFAEGFKHSVPFPYFFINWRIIALQYMLVSAICQHKSLFKKNRICEEFANCIFPILLDFLLVPISSNAERLASKRKGEYNFFHVFAIPVSIIFAAIGSSIQLLLAYTEQALLFPCSSQPHWLSGV